jgi:hypothetical protein
VLPVLIVYLSVGFGLLLFLTEEDIPEQVASSDGGFIGSILDLILTFEPLKYIFYTLFVLLWLPIMIVGSIIYLVWVPLTFFRR